MPRRMPTAKPKESERTVGPSIKPGRRPDSKGSPYRKGKSVKRVKVSY